MKTATFIFKFDSEDETRIVTRSITPEITHRIPKTDIEIQKNKDKIILKITSKDIRSLRAACNSFLRWINTALDVKKTI